MLFTRISLIILRSSLGVLAQSRLIILFHLHHPAAEAAPLLGEDGKIFVQEYFLHFKTYFEVKNFSSR